MDFSVNKHHHSLHAFLVGSLIWMISEFHMASVAQEVFMVVVHNADYHLHLARYILR